MFKDYSIWFLEYAYIKEFPLGLTMMGEFNDAKIKLPHGYVYIEGNGHKILVDTGYSYRGENKKVADFYNLANFQEPKTVLAQIGVCPEDIDTVFLTHAHIDHAANTEAFANAIFYLQERELMESVKLLQLPDKYANVVGAVMSCDIKTLLDLWVDKRLILVNNEEENVLPGIDIYPAHDTHSVGHQWILIRNQDGPWACCGDLVFKYENLVGRNGDGAFVPIVNGGGSQVNLLKVYEQMMDKLNGDASRVIPMHEADLPRRFPSREWSDNLFITEINLADGVASRL